MTDLFRLMNVIMFILFLSSCDNEQTHEQQSNKLLDKARKELQDPDLSKRELNHLHEEISNQRESNIVFMHGLNAQINALKNATKDAGFEKKTILEFSLNELEEKNSELNGIIFQIEKRSPEAREHTSSTTMPTWQKILLLILIPIIVGIGGFLFWKKRQKDASKPKRAEELESDMHIILDKITSKIKHGWDRLWIWFRSFKKKAKEVDKKPKEPKLEKKEPETKKPEPEKKKREIPPKPPKGLGRLERFRNWRREKWAGIRNWLESRVDGESNWLSNLFWITCIILLLFLGYYFREELCGYWRSAVEWVKSWGDEEEEVTDERNKEEGKQESPILEPADTATTIIVPVPVPVHENKKKVRVSRQKVRTRPSDYPPRKRHTVPTRTAPRGGEVHRSSNRGYYPAGTNKNVHELTHEVK